MTKHFTLFTCLIIACFLITFSSCKKSPVADFGYSNDPNEQGKINFTNLSKDATSYTWTFDDNLNGQGSSTETTPSHTYSHNGDYAVTLTADGKGGSNTISRTITVSNVSHGQCIFWTATSAYGFITVKVGGVTVGLISMYSSSGTVPDCGTSGFATVDKVAGTYSFTANSTDGHTWSGNFTITADDCSHIKLI